MEVILFPQYSQRQNFPPHSLAAHHSGLGDRVERPLEVEDLISKREGKPKNQRTPAAG